MPIKLDRILLDIAAEKSLLPNNQNVKKQDIDEAWSRVGKNNNLSVHETRSIFKVLQKKYEQEKIKSKSTWKLFSVMEEIHTNDGSDIKVEDTDMPLEEEEEFEMLEVHEDEDMPPSANTSSEESDNAKPNAASPEKEDVKPIAKYHTSPTAAVKAYTKKDETSPVEEKKLLNTLASATPRSTGQPTASMATQMNASATSLRQKGIIVKKTAGQQQQPSPQQQQQQTRNNTILTQAKNIQNRNQSIQLPEPIKRKLLEESVASSITVKKQNTGQQHTLNSKANNNRRDDDHHHQQQTQQTPAGINIITIPGRSDIVNGSTTTIKTENGFSPRIEDIDFRNDIIFEAGPDSELSGTVAVGPTGVGKCHPATTAGATANSSDIINLGNFENSLPPTFFKNLCNSSRHEALGLYVANVMNRLKARSAAKLELAILRAVLDAQSADLDK